MRFVHIHDFGWLYLLCGLVLTVAAIVLPAHTNLEGLLSKKTSISNDLDELNHRVEVYASFLSDVQRGDAQITQRLVDMQFNQSPDGSSVVIDTSASKTPLAWVAQRAKRSRVVPLETKQASFLSQFVDGQGRLWLLCGGAFTIFIGLIASSTKVESH